jgi:hypothetical protein
MHGKSSSTYTQHLALQQYFSHPRVYLYTDSEEEEESVRRVEEKSGSQLREIHKVFFCEEHRKPWTRECRGGL